MEPNKILIVTKITKVEWDMHRLNLNEEQLKDFYKGENLDYRIIFDSHRNQRANLEKIKNLLGNPKTINRNDLNKDLIKEYDLVISFGGDNHFQFVAHFLDSKPILGINSDPERSEGALTSISPLEFDKINGILNNQLKKEEWTRIKVEIDGTEIAEEAVSEVFIGEERRFNMSRHIIKLNGYLEEQKGSGLLIATGAGSSGWYSSASRYLFSKPDIFHKTSKEARFILTEPYNGKLLSLNLINGKLKENDILEVISLSDSSAYISIDSLKLIKLREGSNIKLKIGKPLIVINPK